MGDCKQGISLATSSIRIPETLGGGVVKWGRKPLIDRYYAQLIVVPLRLAHII
jgi:hypothetical protein